jgi:hypothetical protein
MPEGIRAVLQEWESYYVIVGAAAGALTGLQFVVLTLITESGVLRGSEETLAAFGSPNVVHFCAALLLSAILTVPWHHVGPPGWALGITGVGGVVYSLDILRRARRQRDYRPVLEDWIWHLILPLLAYASLLASALFLPRAMGTMLEVIAGATLLLVFIGVHNAWDTVSYVTVQRTREERAKQRERRPAPDAGAAPAAEKPRSSGEEPA